MQQKNRREKSLGLLCKKFLEFYPRLIRDTDERILISLDEIATRLDVERRRIYDIVNVLESIEVLSRSCKNKYIWHGFNSIESTLVKLKTLAVKSNFLEYTKALMASQLDLNSDLYTDQQQATNVYFESAKHNSNHSDQQSNIETKDCSTQTINISREEKSLGIMSQKFLMLFLTSEDGLVSINFAARVLLGDSKNDITEHGRFKTKIRRLYDIANVLKSVGLIEKYSYTHSTISKPAYVYTGPSVEINREAEYVYNFMNLGNPLSNSKHSLFDHFKRNLDLKCNIPKFDVNTGILKAKNWPNIVKNEIETTNQSQTNDQVINQSVYNANQITENININYQQQTDIYNNADTIFNQQSQFYQDFYYHYSYPQAHNYSNSVNNLINDNQISSSSSSLSISSSISSSYNHNFNSHNYTTQNDFFIPDPLSSSSITKLIKSEQIDYLSSDNLNEPSSPDFSTFYDMRYTSDASCLQPAEKRRKFTHYSDSSSTQIDNSENDSLNSMSSLTSSSLSLTNSSNFQQYYENIQQLPSINTVLN